MKVSGRVEGTISELRAQYGLENLDLAYNHAGTYQGFGWKKGDSGDAGAEETRRRTGGDCL